MSQKFLTFPISLLGTFRIWNTFQPIFGNIRSLGKIIPPSALAMYIWEVCSIWLNWLIHLFLSNCAKVHLTNVFLVYFFWKSVFIFVNLIKLGWSESLWSSICLLGMGRTAEKCFVSWTLWNGWDYFKTTNSSQDKIGAQFFCSIFNPVTYGNFDIAPMPNDHFSSRNHYPKIESSIEK